ncbi:hypothetical protein TRFO_43334 [Tritrichomonas foetus]|uniref:Uncharacterized protein n=1 Tax=Tritrichomonas foetus TaxID=1144522 RepID=A0A1J4KQG8_9EUKA|nr:hypothetical protein TRFO_43334 [Tritrichomonas foetus]|eukprot:OHT13354.1 hypothetical protein TRFO_43334 [Tritrichomonas foetus]
MQRPQSNYSIQGYHQSLPTSPVSQNNVYPPGCQMVEHPVIPGVQPPIEGPAQSMMGACPPQYPSMQQNMAQHNIQPNMYSNMQPNMYSNIRPPIQQPYTMQPQYGQQPNMFGQVGNGMMNAAMGLSSVSPQAYPGAFPSPQQQYGGYPQQQQPQQQQQFGYPR